MKEYFSHDFSARNDPKLVKVLMRLGQAGKGVYWDLIEMLYEQNGYLMLDECESYAFALRTECDLIKRLISEFDLFASDEQVFWSESVLRRLDLRKAKSVKAAESAAKRWHKSEGNAKAMRTHSEGNAIKEKESKVNTADAVAATPEPVNLPSKSQSPATTTAVALTDPADEQHWSESPLTKPLPFKVICERLGFLDIDFEHYRKQALVAAEDANISRTIKQWSSWIRNYLNNQMNGGPLLKPALNMPTVPTPKDRWEEINKAGGVIAIAGVGSDENMNRMKVAQYQKHYPNATIHAIIPR